VRGVINLRGNVLPVVDLRARLGQGMTDASAKHVIIVVNDGTHTTGMLVDAVSDIITLSNTDVQPPPDVMEAGEDSGIEGIAIIDGRMVTLLSTASLSAGLTA